MLCIIAFVRKKHPEFPENFPEKILPGIFGISEIFPGIFPKFSWVSTTFIIVKRVIFALYHCTYTKKHPEFSGSFSCIFRGNFFGNFRNFRNFVNISPGVFLLLLVLI